MSDSFHWHYLLTCQCLLEAWTLPDLSPSSVFASTPSGPWILICSEVKCCPLVLSGPKTNNRDLRLMCWRQTLRENGGREEKVKRDEFSESESCVRLCKCLRLIFILMENISSSKLGWHSLNAASRCCWERRNMCNPNTGTAADKQREYCAAVPAYGRNWKPSNKQRGRKKNRAQSCTCSYTHWVYVRYQWAFPQFNIAESWLGSHHNPFLKDFSRNAVQNSPETLSRH